MQANGSITLNRAETSAIRILTAGHAVFAVTMISIGIIGLVKGDFAFTPAWTGVYKGFPARVALLYLCSIVSLGCGIGLLFRRTAVIASRVLLCYLLLWLVLFRLSHLLFTPTAVGA